MAQVLVRNLPDDDIESLRVASEQDGRSVESYLRDLISREAARRRKLKALEDLDQLSKRIHERWIKEGRDPKDIVPSEQLIREGREEMDAKWDR